MTETTRTGIATTRTGIAVSMWIIATLLGILCLFVTGTLPWVSAIFYVICTLALAEYLRTSPR